MELTVKLPDDNDLLQALAQRIAALIAPELDSTEHPTAWMDVGGAALYLCTTKQAIRAAVKRGQLPGKRPNGRVMFTREELDRYVTQGSA